jgi:hypothetical protein
MCLLVFSGLALLIVAAQLRAAAVGVRPVPFGRAITALVAEGDLARATALCAAAGRSKLALGVRAMLDAAEGPGPLTWDTASLRLAMAASSAVGQATMALAERVAGEGPTIDGRAGALCFDGLTLKAQVLGSHREEDWSWQWVWDKAPGSVPPALGLLGAQLRDQLPQALRGRNGGVPLDYLDAELVAAIGAHLAGYPRVYAGRAGADGVSWYFAVAAD